MKRALFAVAAFALALSASAETKWTKSDKGDFIEITQQGGRTLGYSQNSGLEILTVDGFAFKDLNRNGKLDKYEDWRLPSEERAKDLASQLSLKEIAGLMLYSSHQELPTAETGKRAGTYNGLPFSKAHASPEDLSDKQKDFIINVL